MLLLDDLTLVKCIMLLKEKSEVLKIFMTFKAPVENGKEIKIKCLISNKGVYYTSREFE